MVTWAAATSSAPNAMKNSSKKNGSKPLIQKRARPEAGILQFFQPQNKEYHYDDHYTRRTAFQPHHHTERRRTPALRNLDARHGLSPSHVFVQYWQKGRSEEHTSELQ